MKTKLYHVTEEDPKYKAYGVYYRGKKNIHGVFRLVSIHFSHQAAVTQATGLAEQAPEKDFSIQGGPNAESLPEKYYP